MIRRKDLVDIGDGDYQARQEEFMECQDCDAVIGGTRGDFFMADMNWIINCPECGNDDIALVRKVCKNVIVKR